MVTKKPKGLGMGLEALLGPKVKEAINLDGTAATPDLPETFWLSLMAYENRRWRKTNRRPARRGAPSSNDTTGATALGSFVHSHSNNANTG